MFTYSKFLVSQGCIKPLFDLLNCPDPRIVTVYLEGLENILELGKADKNLDNTREEDETMPPGDASQIGFQFGGGELPVPSGGFNFN
ncbi:hypothetical protein PVK06_048252 [Gossypium arboreum]|uniref:Uncharacterized protein n=1 Tax=Gossypium arboreum TaxID=29729 RepID=A0ABR0MI51_GOSAR|nr:hypothetical protein PVK06_048252 [Gossypium arboreum]